MASASGGLVRGKGQSRDEKTKRPGTCHMDRGQRETTSRRGGWGFLSLCRRRDAGARQRSSCFCWGQRRPEETHILLLLCWGRREGWRNNLDGLGLIKEKERKQTKTAHIVRLRALGWAFLLYTPTPELHPSLDWQRLTSASLFIIPISGAKQKSSKNQQQRCFSIKYCSCVWSCSTEVRSVMH